MAGPLGWRGLGELGHSEKTNKQASLQYPQHDRTDFFHFGALMFRLETEIVQARKRFPCLLQQTIIALPQPMRGGRASSPDAQWHGLDGEYACPPWATLTFVVPGQMREVQLEACKRTFAGGKLPGRTAARRKRGTMRANTARTLAARHTLALIVEPQ